MKQLVNNIKNGLKGALDVPGDKSISHRSVILGSISHGQSIIHHFLLSDDCISTINAFRNMGVDIKKTGSDLLIQGVGLNGLKKPQVSLNMGNSGTTTRLLTGLLSAQKFDSNLIGDQSLSKRPMNRVSNPLNSMGAKISTTNGHLPMKISDGKIQSTEYDLPVASAQVKSAIILAALFAKDDSLIVEKQITRDHTERMLNQFGHDVIENHGKNIIVHSNPELKGQEFTVPGDISSAAFFMVAATLVPGSDLILRRVGINPSRIGIINVLQKMGANIIIKNKQDNVEPTADIEVKFTDDLKPIHVEKNDIPLMIDELPLVALLGAKANGTSTIHGAEELHFKETDRIETVVNEFQKMGINIKGLDDGFEINGLHNWKVNNPVLDSHGDHRIGMTIAVAALLLEDQVKLSNDDSISISYPEFFTDLSKLIKG